jgi:hypothetical protein
MDREMLVEFVKATLDHMIGRRTDFDYFDGWFHWKVDGLEVQFHASVLEGFEDRYDIVLKIRELEEMAKWCKITA